VRLDTRRLSPTPISLRDGAGSMRKDRWLSEPPTAERWHNLSPAVAPATPGEERQPCRSRETRSVCSLDSTSP
jgi:hypothetical protein